MLVSNFKQLNNRLMNLVDLRLPFEELYCLPHGETKALTIQLLLERYGSKAPWVFVDDNRKNCLEIMLHTDMTNCRGIVCQDLPYNDQWRNCLIRGKLPSPSVLHTPKSLPEVYTTALHLLG